MPEAAHRRLHLLQRVAGHLQITLRWVVPGDGYGHQPEAEVALKDRAHVPAWIAYAGKLPVNYLHGALALVGGRVEKEVVPFHVAMDQRFGSPTPPQLIQMLIQLRELLERSHQLAVRVTDLVEEPDSGAVNREHPGRSMREA